ncbi:MAG: acyl-CoA desaturase [Hahellaceae bacterium]|nr:acyl-CoA desaturase [Hahellaceae bacterium]
MSFNVVNNQSESKAACAGKGSLSGFFNRVIRWVDAEAAGPADQIHSHTGNRIDWVRCIPFIALHIACLGVIWVGVSPVAVLMCLAMFVLRMFAITAFYHRYFAHRSFKTSRGWQFFFAALGNTACQRGALWWASHHRKHHKHSDQDADLHSPVRHGFWWSHVGWFMCEDGFKTDYSVIKDWAKFPELRFLNRFDVISPAIFAVLIYGAGEVIAAFWPEAGTSGMQMLVWGFVVSTVLLFHATFTINSLGHIWGSRRFNTQDHSRNNAVLALLTLGEGWHNNHHRFAVSARQGFYWWELDISYLLLKMLSWIGVVRDLNPVPERILQEGRDSRRAQCMGGEDNHGN